MKGIYYDITPTLGSSAGYREKRSHNRMIYWHTSNFPQKYINVISKGRIQLNV